MEIGKLAALIAVCAVTGAFACGLTLLIDRYVNGPWLTVASAGVIILAVVVAGAALMRYYQAGTKETEEPETVLETPSTQAVVPGP